MEERRRSKRYPKRLTLRYGEKDMDRAGFTADVSQTGIFVVAQSIPPPIDARIHVQVILDGTRTLYLECIVRRHKIPPASMRDVEQTGFGVRLLSHAEILAEMVPSSREPESTRKIAVPPGPPRKDPDTRKIMVSDPPAAPAAAFAPPTVPAVGVPAPVASVNRLEIPYSSKEDLKKAFDREIRLGGIYVRTDRAFGPHDAVMLALRLDFSGKTILEFQARVISVVPGQGVAFGFDDKDKVVAVLGPVLA